MALDETNLLVLQKSGTEKEKLCASQILPVRRQSYLLLCTLLVANAIVNETLPILIDRISGEGWSAILISTMLLLIFAEILPQAFFTRYGLVAGAKLIW
jgi:metal transporter CNNM